MLKARERKFFVWLLGVALLFGLGWPANRDGQAATNRVAAAAPALTQATYLGGSDVDSGLDIAVDAAGNVYVAGTTNSRNFPVTPGALQNGRGDGDIFVAKLNPAGTALVYCALFGGSDSDRASSLAVDAAGNVYLTGATASSDFPVTTGAPQTTWRNGDAFVAKLNVTGTALSYATYLGGSGNEVGYGIAVNNAGDAYVSGLTASTDFPATPGALRTRTGGAVDAFVAKLNAAGTIFSYATYLGGAGSEIGYAIAVDNAGSAYVTGGSSSLNFPTTLNAYQGQLSAGTLLGDAFVAKLNAAGAALIYATLLGGNGVETAYHIALDDSGNAYIAGETMAFGAANNFPVTANAWQRIFGGGNPATDGFVAKLNAAGTALGYATYLGAGGPDRATSLAVDAAGNAFVAGYTGSADFTVTSGALSYTGNVDAFVAQLDAAGASLGYFTYFGGGHNDQGLSLALDAAGNIHVVGSTASASFPVTPGAFQPNLGGGQDAFIFTLNGAGTIGLKIIANVSAASYRGTTLAREAIIAAFGSQLATQTATAADPNTPGVQLPTTLAGIGVLVKDNLGVERAAPLFFVSPGQINYQMPPGTAVGAALVTITSNESAVALGTTSIATIAPGLFAASSTGQGAASGYVLRKRADGTQSLESIAQPDAQNRWVTNPIDLGPPTDQVFLVLFGTGWRLRRELAQVSAKIDETEARVDYAEAQGNFIGLDQINLGPLPRSLAGRGKVDVALMIEGKVANNVMIEIR